ncbi:CatB-related O-acetyltransferase [Streptomyces sp900116325]|uniref:CatB-related O-acetyltransferase n=1 Tax=Streptomyces sp. 900116325 TaxID=3154295 RepID=A0ABV2U633_9ACTN
MSNIYRRARHLIDRLQEVATDADKVRFERLVRAGRVHVGVNTYGYPDVRTFIHEEPRLVVGNYCSLACATFLLGGGHPTNRVTTYPLRIRLGLEGAGNDGYPTPSRDTILGSDVWVGANALILSGVRIGHGAVVAGGSVVCGDVPPYAIVGGNPARIIRRRYSDSEVAALTRIAWWDWPESEIRECVDLLSGADISKFVEYAVNRQPSPAPRTANAPNL